MPALGTIAITDGVTPTPVTHTFVGRSTTGSDAVFKNSASSSIPQGFETLEIGVYDPSRTSTTAAYTISVSIVLPTTVTDVSGITNVDHQSKMDMTFRISQKSSLQERKNIPALVSSFFANSQVKQMFENIEPFY